MVRSNPYGKYRFRSVKDYFIGDSHTGASVGNLTYPKVFELMHPGRNYFNRGAGGYQMADHFYWVMMLDPALNVGERCIHMMGTNDWNNPSSPNPASVAELNLFDLQMQSHMMWLIGNKKIAKSDPSWTFDANWTNSTLYDTSPTNPTPGASQGKRTTTNGAQASIQFTGDSFDLCYTVQDGNTSGIDIYVDGVFKFTQATAAPGGYALLTSPGNTATIVNLHSSGYGAGTHTLKCVANVPFASAVEIDWLSTGPIGCPMLVLSGILANVGLIVRAPKVNQYNTQKQTFVNTWRARGWPIYYLDVTSELNTLFAADTNSDLQPDGGHPSARAMVQIAQRIP
jgi:hypothetical protein